MTLDHESLPIDQNRVVKKTFFGRTDPFKSLTISMLIVSAIQKIEIRTFDLVRKRLGLHGTCIYYFDGSTRLLTSMRYSVISKYGFEPT